MFLDCLVVIALGFGVYKGMTQGFFVSLASFLSLMIGTIGALKFSNLIKDFLYNSLGWDSKFVPVMAFVLAFFLAVFLTRLLAKFITKMFEAVMLGLVNRLLGILFQFLLTSFMVCLVLSMFDEININHFLASEETLNTSTAYRMYQSISQDIWPSVFQMVKHLFEKSVDVITTTTPVSA
ncbi:MAG: CvpA family protein [Flavobacteriaceae bacterium]|jgi:membrane protein required for colicin V production|nr:CvpA family protein [Flavobacteriaceae bacterium]